MPVPLPAFFGKYQLLSHIAEGGMADVYLARLPGPGGFEKRLVVKVIRPELAARREFCELFVAEAKLTVSLSHANIVPVYELGTVEGQYYLAMELVDGPTLHTLIFDPRPGRGGPLPPPLCAYIAEQVLRGLDYAHRCGVVHRDLSSANVMCSREGEVKIVDFGIAAHYSAQHAGVRLGSAGYMAPEQQDGTARVDARSDLYPVGVLLAEMLSGKRFAAFAEWEGRGAVPPALLRIIETATSADPAARYPDAATMLAELSHYLRDSHADEGARPPTQSDLSRLVRRRAPDERRPAHRPSAPWPFISPRARDLPREGPSTRPLRDDATPVLGTRTPRTPRTGRATGPSGLIMVPETRPVEALGLEVRRPLTTPPLGLAPVPVPATPAEDVAVHEEAPRVELPPAGGTVTFASRPAGYQPTWRTYAGGLLLAGLAISTWAVRGQHSPPPPAPGSRTGVLHIDLPAGAVLKLDGGAVAPGRDLTVAPGRHHIQAQAPGHRPVMLDVEVHRGESLRERLGLPWSVGHLRLDSEPPGAAVTLDGEAAGSTPLDLDVPLDRKAGLRLGLRGYAPLSREILPSEWVAAAPEARLGPGVSEAEAQPEMRLHLRLQPLGRGSLTVGAAPWAQVFVDGERKGDTPLRRLPLSAGPHSLRLSCPRPGCPRAREFRQNVVIEPGRELRRVVDFHSEPPQIKE